jgi:hypothetical protein
MAAGTKSSVSKVALLIALIPVGIAVFYVAKFFLPVWLWMNVDFAKIARDSGAAESQLRKEFTMKVRYAPRGDGDPIPWQIIEMTPAWSEVDPSHDDEFQTLVRVHFIAAKHGGPPSQLILGSGGAAGFQDRYFDAKGYRLPPGSLGYPKARPVVVYTELEKMTNKGTSGFWDATVKEKGWMSDDDWEGRADGWEPQAP